mmetsp:Transcript_10673/g.26979  ORF Transcript_10673/g.26979 Transcript_10673/m.26979 type:complete len:293 (+) Transcript_10673:74-952(+)
MDVQRSHDPIPPHGTGSDSSVIHRGPTDPCRHLARGDHDLHRHVHDLRRGPDPGHHDPRSHHDLHSHHHHHHHHYVGRIHFRRHDPGHHDLRHRSLNVHESDAEKRPRRRRRSAHCPAVATRSLQRPGCRDRGLGLDHGRDHFGIHRGRLPTRKRVLASHSGGSCCDVQSSRSGTRSRSSRQARLPACHWDDHRRHRQRCQLLPDHTVPDASYHTDDSWSDAQSSRSGRRNRANRQVSQSQATEAHSHRLCHRHRHRRRAADSYRRRGPSPWRTRHAAERPSSRSGRRTAAC